MRRFLSLVTVRPRVGLPVAVVALAMTGLLAACGSSTPAATSTSSSTSSPGASEAACNLMTLSEAITITGDTSGSLRLMSAKEVAEFDTSGWGVKAGVCLYLDPAVANTSAWAFEGPAPSGTSAAAVAAAVIHDTGWSTGVEMNNPFGSPCTESWQPVSGMGNVAYACTSTKYSGYALAFIKNSTLVVGGNYGGTLSALEQWARQAAGRPGL